MKTTVDIPEADLQEAIRHTGARTKREAVGIALTELNRRRRLRKLPAVRTLVSDVVADDRVGSFILATIQEAR